MSTTATTPNAGTQDTRHGTVRRFSPPPARGVVVLLVIAAAAMGTGCAFKAPSGRASADVSPVLVDKQPYRIRVGDAVDVRFYKTPELNAEKIPVRNDGKISLDLVGDVQAAGLGTDELSANLVHDYSGCEGEIWHEKSPQGATRGRAGPCIRARCWRAEPPAHPRVRCAQS